MTKRFTYHLYFTVKTDLTPQFESSFGQVIEAHMKHEKGLGKIMKFSRTFAGERDVISIHVDMDSLGEMDKWMHTPELVLEYYGQEQGLKVLKDYCDSTEAWNSHITEQYTPTDHIQKALA